jgi:hypothetical protein
MAEAPLSGFPLGEISFRSEEDALIDRLYKIANSLLVAGPAHLPPVTYEKYELNLAAPEGSEESEHWQTKLCWPISREEYDAFWQPAVDDESGPEQDHLAVESTPPAALDIFRPEAPDEMEEEDDPQARAKERRRLERAALAARLAVVSAVLDRVPGDAFIQTFLDSHGEFDHATQDKLMHLNLPEVDRDLFTYRDGQIVPVFGANTSMGSDGSVVRIVGTYTSLLDGQAYRSDSQRADWERAIREDVQHLVEKLGSVPQYYLDRFDENGHLLSGERYGIDRQVGTVATREFFEGFYQFAAEGVTLLKVTRQANLFGALEFKNNWATSEVNSIYVALKHGVSGRPHLVRLQAVISDEYLEAGAEVRAFQHAGQLDGVFGRSRIGGDYGDMRRDPEESIRLMGEDLRRTIPAAMLEMIRRGEPVGTEETHFSHTDFYNVVEYLSKLALSDF